MSIPLLDSENFLTLSRLLNEWRQDSVIDKILLDESSLKTPCLHAKYLEYLCALKKQGRELSLRKKSDFPAPERRNNPDYQRHEELSAQNSDAIEACTEIIQSINQRQWTIKNTIAWRQFVQGADV